MIFTLLQITSASNDFIGYAIAGLLIWIIVLSITISSSTNQGKHLKHEKAQIMLLSRIAIKLGVDAKEVNDAIKDIL